MKIKVLNVNEDVETELELEGWESPEFSFSGVYEVVKSIETNGRQGTLATKSRGEVAGGGKKPWPQKHTGRARHSTIRSPLWRKGGHTFALKPKEYYLKVNSKQKKKVMTEVLKYKLQKGLLLVLENLNLENPSTKKAKDILSRLGVSGNQSLLVTQGANEFVYKSFRNIPKIKVTTLEELNVRDILVNQYIILEKNAFTVLLERSNNGYLKCIS